MLVVCIVITWCNLSEYCTWWCTHICLCNLDGYIPWRQYSNESSLSQCINAPAPCSWSWCRTLCDLNMHQDLIWLQIIHSQKKQSAWIGYLSNELSPVWYYCPSLTLHTGGHTEGWLTVSSMVLLPFITITYRGPYGGLTHCQLLCCCSGYDWSNPDIFSSPCEN